MKNASELSPTRAIPIFLSSRGYVLLRFVLPLIIIGCERLGITRIGQSVRISSRKRLPATRIKKMHPTGVLVKKHPSAREGTTGLRELAQ